MGGGALVPTGSLHLCRPRAHGGEAEGGGGALGHLLPLHPLLPCCLLPGAPTAVGASCATFTGGSQGSGGGGSAPPHSPPCPDLPPRPRAPRRHEGAAAGVGRGGAPRRLPPPPGRQPRHPHGARARHHRHRGRQVHRRTLESRFSGAITKSIITFIVKNISFGAVNNNTTKKGSSYNIL